MQIMGRNVRAGRARSLAVAAAVTVASVGLVACGSSGDSSTTSGNSNSATTGQTSSGIADAQRLAKDATNGAVLGPGAGPLTLPAEALTAAGGAESIKPTPFKPGGPQKSVAVMECGPTAICTHTSDLIVAIVQKLGWKAKAFASQELTPAANQAAFNAALASKPDAIISFTASGSLGPQLARAKREGIYTVNINGTEVGGKGYDAYVGGGYSLAATVLAANMIVAGNGKSNIQYALLPEIPILGLKEGSDFVKEHCPDCTLTTQNVPVANVLEPVPMGQLATSIIRKNPKLNYFANASTDVQVKAASQAFRAAGSTAKVVGANLNGPTAMANLNSGDLPFLAGAPQEWGALQAVDAVIRGLDGKPAVPADKAKIGVYLMTKENAPANPNNEDGPVDRWAVQQFDFVAPYSKAWGVDLSSVAADSK